MRKFVEVKVGAVIGYNDIVLGKGVIRYPTGTLYFSQRRVQPEPYYEFDGTGYHGYHSSQHPPPRESVRVCHRFGGSHPIPEELPKNDFHTISQIRVATESPVRCSTIPLPVIFLGEFEQAKVNSVLAMAESGDIAATELADTIELEVGTEWR